MTVAALMDFDPWRDLTLEQWRQAGYSRPKSPLETYLDYPSLPIPPLGVQIADWAGNGQYDERLERGGAPWVLPSTVVRDGEMDELALMALAKKREYLPAGWRDERNDRTATGGTVAIAFPAPPRLISPGPLVFVVRLKSRATLTIDGQPCELNILGVNARLPPDHLRIRRGWHSYAVLCPGRPRPTEASSFVVHFASARCSQFLLSVTSVDV